MKKILFVLPHMLCGGVEKALLSLVNELPKEEYEITVLMVKAEGDFVQLIPKEIHSGELPLKEIIRDELMLGGIKESLKYYLKKGKIIKFSKVALNVITKNPLATLTCKFDRIEGLSKEYDTAICFHIHMPFIVRYVAEKVNANKKIAWIHNDFKTTAYSVQSLSDYLKQYDHFFAVSEQLENEFISILPQFKDRISVVHNIISEQYIRNCLSNYKVEEYTKEENCLKLLTIGRLDKQKGYDIAIKACAILKNKGYDFKWYALGNGKEEEQLKQLIHENNLDDTFILLGIRMNPYPYLNQCDIYVQPSRHEGYCTTVEEARALNKPMVCTEFTAIREQLIDHKTGTIVETDEKKLAEGIEELINNEKLRNEYMQNLSSIKIENKEVLEQIIKCF